MNNCSICNTPLNNSNALSIIQPFLSREQEGFGNMMTARRSNCCDHCFKIMSNKYDAHLIILFPIEYKNW